MKSGAWARSIFASPLVSPPGRPVARSPSSASRRGTASARLSIGAIATPAMASATGSAASTRCSSARRIKVAAHASGRSCSDARVGPSTCSVMILPRSTSAATTGGTQPGSMSARRTVTATSWAKTPGTALAHIGPRSVAKLTVVARAQTRSILGALRRRTPTASSRSSIHAVRSSATASAVDRPPGDVIGRTSDTRSTLASQTDGFASGGVVVTRCARLTTIRAKATHAAIVRTPPPISNKANPIAVSNGTNASDRSRDIAIMAPIAKSPNHTTSAETAKTAATALAPKPFSSRFVIPATTHAIATTTIVTLTFKPDSTESRSTRRPAPVSQNARLNPTIENQSSADAGLVDAGLATAWSETAPQTIPVATRMATRSGTLSEVGPQECDRPLEREVGRFRPVRITRRLREPVARPGVAMDDHVTAGRPDRPFEFGDPLRRLVWIVLGEMAEDRHPRGGEDRAIRRPVIQHRPDDGVTDGREPHRPVRAEREPQRRDLRVRSDAFAQAIRRGQDDPVDGVLVGGMGELLGIFDRGRDLSAEHVGCGHGEFFFQAEDGIRDDIVIQTPPRVQDDDSGCSVAEISRGV